MKKSGLFHTENSWKNFHCPELFRLIGLHEGKSNRPRSAIPGTRSLEERTGDIQIRECPVPNLSAVGEDPYFRGGRIRAL